MTTERALVVCVACGRPYAGRVHEDGAVVIPTDDGRCPCGSAEFEHEIRGVAGILATAYKVLDYDAPPIRVVTLPPHGGSRPTAGSRGGSSPNGRAGISMATTQRRRSSLAWMRASS